MCLARRFGATLRLLIPGSTTQRRHGIRPRTVPISTSGAASPIAATVAVALAIVCAIEAYAAANCAGSLAKCLIQPVGSLWSTRLEGTVSEGQPAGVETVLVERVVDGDTFVADDGRIVRVLAMDAPETSNPNLERAQPLGDEAARRLSQLIAGQVVALERDVSDVDHYGRLLRHVWVGDQLVSETMVREGLGRSSSIPPDLMYADRIRRAEHLAEEQRRGLWGQERPTSLPIFRDQP